MKTIPKFQWNFTEIQWNFTEILKYRWIPPKWSNFSEISLRSHWKKCEIPVKMIIKMCDLLKFSENTEFQRISQVDKYCYNCWKLNDGIKIINNTNKFICYICYRYMLHNDIYQKNLKKINNINEKYLINYLLQYKLSGFTLYILGMYCEHIIIIILIFLKNWVNNAHLPIVCILLQCWSILDYLIN